MARVTKVQLDRWAECERQATELRRQATALSKEAEAIESIAKADLESTGKPTANRSGYRLELVDGRLSVAWKDELVSRLGAGVVTEITTKAEASRPKVIRITPPAVAA